jgi:hypothetical protein
MKLGRLLRGLGAAGLVALVSAPLGAGVASAAPPPPPAYTALTKAYPLAWSGAGLSVGDLRVPYVSGLTNNAAVADAHAVLALSDLKRTTMSGEEINGLSCTGFSDTDCKDPFLPHARSERLAGSEPPRIERTASFVGKEGKFPGRIHSLVECGADCTKDVTHSFAEASGASGEVATYFAIGGSSASQELSLDDRGRLVSVARSTLNDVVIGPKGEVRFSRLTTAATAFGSGADNAKDGRVDLRVENFVILDNPVELTRAGLRLAGGGPSEQEAYDGAKALLEKLKERGITLGLPDFNAQIDRKPDHATVQVQGLRVHFERSVQGPQGVQAQSVASDLELGSTTALVAASDKAGKIEVSDKDGEVVVDSSKLVQPSAGGPAETARPRSGKSQGNDSRSVAKGPGLTFVPQTPAPGAQVPSALPQPATPANPDTALSGEPSRPDQVAFPDVGRALGLRDARAVSRAFGAFLGLGLILPVARLVIRRFG